MNKNKHWNQNKRGGNTRGFNRGGRGGGNWGWGGNRQGFHNFQEFGNSRYGGFCDNMPQWENRPKRETPGKRLSEVEIGVTEYVSQHEGFNGIIKLRYSDFQVSEINENGEIAKLTNLKAPKPPAEETVDDDEDLLLNKYNLEILPMETWDQINSLAVNAKASDEIVEIDVTGVTKEQRTKIHDAVKKAFGVGIVSSTVSVDDKKFVRFRKFRKGVRIDNRVKWIWPGQYVYFVVYKENCDTMDAAVRIAESIGIKLNPSMLAYAGTKDRRAKTSQWFSARKVDPRKLASRTKRLKDIYIGNYTFSSTTLKLGMLKGNQFRIALRNVTAEDEVVETACSNLRERGFVNYYGLQRFGTRPETPTYTIGLKLMQGNFKEAIDTILERRPGPLEQILRVYQTLGAGMAATILPSRPQDGAHSEANLIRALAQRPNDLLGALCKVARNTRLLYLHSYQSLVWNHAVSERLQRFGFEPAAGDLVPLTQVQEEMEEEDLDREENKNDIEDNQDGVDQQDVDDEPDDDQQDVDNQPDGDQQDVDNQLDDDQQDVGDQKDDDAQQDSSVNQDGDSKQSVQQGDFKIEIETNNTAMSVSHKNKGNKNRDSPKPKIPVKVLTQEDVDSGRYTIFDIVLPLPGYNIDYPPNMIDFYEKTLKKDGLRLEMTHKVKIFSMSGAYRYVVARPLEMSWRRVRYSDPLADLISSDIDQLRGRKLDGIVEDGKYKALIVTMTLPSSCYATMALRELLKADTSCDHQARQNNYHEKSAPESGEKRKMEEEPTDGDDDAKKQKQHE